MGWPKLKSILILVPADLDEGLPEKGVTAFRNFGEYTRQEMYDAAGRWLDAHPGAMVMYDDDQLTPDEPSWNEEEGIVVDGLYVPPHMLHAPKGGIKWGVRKKKPT